MSEYGSPAHSALLQACNETLAKKLKAKSKTVRERGKTIKDLRLVLEETREDVTEFAKSEEKMRQSSLVLADKLEKEEANHKFTNNRLAHANAKHGAAQNALSANFRTIDSLNSLIEKLQSETRARPPQTN